jgi:hypothetical protein
MDRIGVARTTEIEAREDPLGSCNLEDDLRRWNTAIHLSKIKNVDIDGSPKLAWIQNTPILSYKEFQCLNPEKNADPKLA